MNELLRQRDMRKMIGIEPQALGLVRGQGRAQTRRSLADIGRWQNGNVKRQEFRQHRAAPNAQCPTTQFQGIVWELASLGVGS